jgi:hypothetical protein
LSEPLQASQRRTQSSRRVPLRMWVLARRLLASCMQKARQPCTLQVKGRLEASYQHMAASRQPETGAPKNTENPKSPPTCTRLLLGSQQLVREVLGWWVGLQPNRAAA